MAERHLRERQVRQQVVAERAAHRDLLARREVARAGDLAGVIASRITQSRRGLGVAAPTHEVQPWSRYCLATCAAQSVLLVRHLLDRVQRLRVGPAEVRVRLAHSRHERRARTVDHRHAGDRHAARAARDARDAFLDQDSPGWGCAPVASRMRTLVNRTLAMGRLLFGVRPNSCKRNRARPRFRRTLQSDAFLRLLQWRPVAAAAQDLDAAAGDFLSHHADRLRRRDDVLVAGDEQRRARDLGRVGRLHLGERLATPRIAVRVLRHQ